ARASSSPGPWIGRRSSSTSSTRTPPSPMQHSHEALDRPGGLSSVNLLAPLRHRDFRLLWAGMTVSLLGDGIFLVAIAWEAYVLWNAPAALSIVGIGMTVPTIAFLLPGGVVTDRLDRRRVRRRRRVVRCLGRGGAGDAAAAGPCRGAGARVGSAQGGAAVRAAAGLALGDAALGGFGLPRVPRADRGAPAVRGEERSWRLCARPRPRVRRRRRRRGRRGARHGSAWPTAPRRDVHLRGLDAGDTRRRRLRARHGGVAARGRLPPLQRPRGGGDDRV